MPYSAINPSKAYNPMTRLYEADGNRFIVEKASHPNYLSRYHGGNRRDNHPYISGYWYFLVNPPERLFNNANGAKNMEKARDWLFTTAESFTPPSRNLTVVDVPGMGGLGSSYVAGQTISRTFTTAFREYQEMPIMNILQTWTSVLDPNTGVSPLQGDEFIPANYKGSAYAALCKPTIGSRAGGPDLTALAREDIEQIYYFDGVFPEGAPFDTFSSDIATNDTQQISVTWSFDGFPLLKDSKGVIEQFLKLTSDLYISDTYDSPVNSVASAISAARRTDSV